MPTYARGQIVVEDMVGVYHCIARCVRRAFLCGIDPYTGQLSLEERGRLARSLVARRRADRTGRRTFYVSRQVTTPRRWSS